MNREISIEDGFQIVMLFLRDLWWDFLKNEMVENGVIDSKINQSRDKEGILKRVSPKDDLHFDNDFFFLTVCNGTSSDDYFEEVIEERMNIPPIKQHGRVVVKEDFLFQITVDFCNYFNNKYKKNGKDSLRFTINWLEDMRNNPKAHKIEWDLWNQTIVEVTEQNRRSLGLF